MNIPTSVPPQVREAIRDLCCVIADNATLKNGVLRAAAARLADRLDKAGDDFALMADEIILAVDMAEIVAKAIMDGTPLVGSKVLFRVCERVVNPLTDALGYRQP